ncbi:MAG: hypothetical protein ABJD07_13660, partial [Gemmatimonadaceae bacterium]
QQIDAGHWSVCACQGAPVGTVTNITASYPARAVALAATSRLRNVALRRETTFTLSAAKGTANPAGCSAADASRTAQGAGAERAHSEREAV